MINGKDATKCLNGTQSVGSVGWIGGKPRCTRPELNRIIKSMNNRVVAIAFTSTHFK